MAASSTPGLAYRPFDGTDAAVADPGELEVELQPAGARREPSQKTLIAPAAVLNFGLKGDWEAVFQRQLETPLSPSGPSSLTEAGAFLKHVLRPGSLQDKSAPSVATEFGVLLPDSTGTSGIGATVAGIISQRWDIGAVHFNAATTLTRDHHADAFVSTIVEGPSKWTVRPVAEIFYEEADVSIDFESDAVGAVPKGWTATRTGRGDSKWTVEQDQAAPSKAKILKQSGVASYPLLLKDDSNIENGFIEMKFKAIAGSEDRAAGMVWRAADANNYYVVRANALEDNVVLYRTVDGIRSSLDIVGRKGGYGVDVPVPANQWLDLRVEFKGSRFKVFYNGKQLFEVDDPTFGRAGKVGLWTKADSVILFDQIIYGDTK